MVENILHVKIGCKEKTIENWVEWFEGNEVFETQRDTLEFNRIKGMFFAFKSYTDIVGIENLFPVNEDAGKEGKATSEKFKKES